MTALSSGGAAHANDLKVMSLVGTGHLFSHFYILLLPPLFPLLRDAYGVSYTALGLAIALLNITTGATQAPVGFLVDRFGARRILIAGLALFSLAIGLVGVFPTYPALLALMAVAGLGNSVFHPADYAILSSAVDQRRMGRAFSIHTFGGFAGFALAPPVIVGLTELFGWQVAMMLSGLGGLVVALLMLLSGHMLTSDADARRAGGAQATLRSRDGVRLLLGAPILMALLFFVMLALSMGGYTSFSVAALEGIYDLPLVAANVPLTAYLVASAIGVLAGGWVADRTRQHHRVVGACFVGIVVFAAAVPALRPTIGLVTLLFALAGFCSGMVAPARDMMVRAVTPPGQSGKVFGFVTTGFNIGGVLAPLLFGLVLDLGDPGHVFWMIATLSALTLIVIFAAPRTAATGDAAPVRH
jgi:FSR family fosmidomycin resistance protein-like MFS transporter